MKTNLLVLFILFAIRSSQAQNDGTPFPVSLSSFEGGVLNNGTKLKWKTECYISYANFQIQRSTDASSFTTIRSFVADRLRRQQPFEFIDSKRYASGVVYYRINAGDVDGHFYNSKIIKISNKQTDTKMISVYPTLIHSTTNIVFSSAYDNTINVGIVNSSGILIKRYIYNIKKGVSNLNLNLNDISKGVYRVNAIDAKGNRQSLSIIKQ